MISDKKDSQNLIRVLTTFLILFLITNLLFALFQVLNSPFDHDEYQHVHIGWSVANGKLIYKDFFEHHGPVFALLNGFLIDTFSLQPGLNTLIVLRLISFSLLLLILRFTYLIATEFFNTRLAGLFSASLLSGLLFIREAATEIRPDVLQNVFWLASVYIYLINIKKEKKYLSLLIGILLGFAIMTNSKAAVGIAAIYTYIFIRLVIDRHKIKWIVYEGLLILTGILFVFGIISIYFQSNNSFKEFFFYNYKFNLIALLEYHSRNLKEYAGILIKSQTAFVIAGIVSILIYLKSLRSIRFIKANPDIFYILIITTITSATVFLGLYKQQYLLFLPLLSVLIFSPFKIILAKTETNKNNIIYIIVFTIILFGNLLYASISDTPFVQTDEQKQQNRLTQFILDNSKRSEPIFFLWNNYGGYMFNENVQYFWLENEGFKTLFNRIAGYEVFGENLINNLKTKNVRYLITPQKHLKMVLSKDAFNFVMQNYNTENEFNGHLWIRNN